MSNCLQVPYHAIQMDQLNLKINSLQVEHNKGLIRYIVEIFYVQPYICKTHIDVQPLIHVWFLCHRHLQIDVLFVNSQIGIQFLGLVWFGFMVLNVTFGGENHRPVSSHWQTLLHNVVSGTPHMNGFELTTLVVINTDCMGSLLASNDVTDVCPNQ